jgi:membrane-associated protease RseP (regulator of RpoE activity)
MRRGEFWLVVFVALLTGMSVLQHVAAQEQIEPSPVADEPELAADLPLPEHSLVVEKPARDNSRAYFGVTFDPQFPNAAVARSVTAGSPADEAGVQAGDAIVSLNGQEVSTYDDVLRLISRLRPGDVLDIEVSRRVSVRARAVLDGAPIGVEHTAGYRVESEALPAPDGYQSEPPVARAPVNRAPVNRPPSNVAAPRSRQGFSNPQNRNTNADRDGSSNRANSSNDRSRDNRARAGFFRRGR